MPISLKTKIPGPVSNKVLTYLRKHNGGWNVPHPYVHSKKGEGCYFEDLDGNVWLDFASQVASNPLGYNHPELLEIVREYANRFPIKFAGQDFSNSEHAKLIESLLSIAPKKLDAAFLINSGAEAVENAGKICFKARPAAKFSISMEGAFHGRTLGALSLTNSKKIHRQGYPRLPVLRLPFNDNAGPALERILNQEAQANEIAFVIMEPIQGEGGYRFASQKMINDLKKITAENEIPLICDEIQSGMGRTGKWWGFEHYGISPDLFTTAKALQVAAVVSDKKRFPSEPGAISSTWGGGHVLDLAIGIKTIEIIKKQKLLSHNQKIGDYALRSLRQLSKIKNPRGLGLMLAFDVSSHTLRDNVVVECAKNGLVILGCGTQGIRLIPPYVAQKEQIDEAFSVIEQALKTCTSPNFRHKGPLCEYMHCGRHVT